MNIIWFRNDLRTVDHPALSAALDSGPCMAVFLICAQQWREHDVGDNRLGFLLRCVTALRADLVRLNIPLHIENVGTFAAVPKTLLRIAKLYKATDIYCTDEQPLNERIRDSRVALLESVQLHSFDSGCLLPPGAVLKDDGNPYTVFTPFKKRWLLRLDAAARTPLPEPAPQPTLKQSVAKTHANIPANIDGVQSKKLMALHADLWPGGSIDACHLLSNFAEQALGSYHERRDMPDLPGTSRLSPYLAIGAISARQCLAAALSVNNQRAAGGHKGADTWISELIWRDFYRHIVIMFPQVNQYKAFRADTERVPWRHNQHDFTAWCEGRTGYPLVDAAMRQLNQTGWMHNRLRMVSAMFLSKHLLLDWRWGERYFMQQLVDGDFAANNGGWQWSASTGTDAAPYFRIFNPATQAERFDADGAFVCRYVTELEPLRAIALPKYKKQFFYPWLAKGKIAEVLQATGYPEPVVEHKFARERALAAFKAQ